MTYFEDAGSVIPIPIDTLPEFLASREHGDAHAHDVRNFRVLKTEGPTTTLSFERLREGRWFAAASRVTEFRPFCVCIEEVKGTYAGTRFVILYRRTGKRTRVDVYGDVQSKVYPASVAKRLFLRALEGAHREDLLALLAWRKKRPRPTSKRPS